MRNLSSKFHLLITFAISILPTSTFGGLNQWTFSIPSTSTGSFTANETSGSSVTVGGTYSRLANGFVKMTVTTSSGSNAPTNGTIKYGIELPGFAYFSQPFRTNERKIIGSVSAGTCPSNTWTGIFMYYLWAGTSGTATNVSSTATPAFGLFSWNPGTGNASITQINNLADYATIAGATFTNAGVCSNGVITFSGLGDRGGSLYLTNENSGILMTATERAIYVMPQNAIPAAADLNGTYAAYVMDESAWQNIYPIRITIAAGTTGTGDELSDIDNSTADTTKSWQMANISVNPNLGGTFNGIFTADLTLEGSATRKCMCGAYFRNKTMLFCAAQNPANAARPLNFVMVSDNQAYGSGTLDSYSWGTSGKAISTMGTGTDTGYALQLDSNLRVLLAGTTSTDSAIARYTYNGQLDSSFGTGGRVITDAVAGKNDELFAMAQQSNGRIVVAGYVTNANDDFLVMRYTTGGVLDTTWDADGIYHHTISAAERAQAVGIDSTGKVVAVGWSNTGNNDYAVVRYTTGGALDTTFSADGKFTHTMSNGADAAYGMVILSDNRIVSCGGLTSGGGGRMNWGLARYTTAGALDTTWDSDGMVSTSYSSKVDVCQALVVQSDGKIVGVGYSTTGANKEVWAATRYLTNGALDTTFDSDGKANPSLGAGDERAQAVALQTDGKIIIGGYAATDSNDYAIMRLTTAGALDTTFNSTGKYTTTTSAGSSDIVYGVAIQADGRILGGGVGALDFAVIRLWGN